MFIGDDQVGRNDFTTSCGGGGSKHAGRAERSGGSVQSINLSTTDVVEIPIEEIKVNRRMRRTDEERIKDLAESIKNIDCSITYVSH